MSNFLAIPAKQAHPIPTFASHLLNYITNHFRDAHPEAFRKDVDTLAGMRKEWVEVKAEAHPEVVRGLMRYHAQLAFLSTKFPSDISLSFTYDLPFPTYYTFTGESSISLPSITFERASVLYNTAAVYASMAAAERRAEADGIKRALGYLTSSAGVLNYIITAILPILRSELSSPQAGGYDMTDSYLGTLREFVLAEAQECYWQQAVLQGSYKNGLIGKLSMKVAEYYKSALSTANGSDYPSASFFPPNWIAHITVKQMHFEAAAQYRLSQEDLEKSRYGEEIGRLKVAEGLAKKGLDARKGVAEAVVADLRNLQAAVKSALDRAVRDNDLVYVQPVPPASQLTPIVGAGMVKVATPTEIAEPVAWLMGGGAGQGALFSALVPYGVHLALSIYDDRKDTVVRELDRRREELDGLAASTLQSLNLPGSIQALERPAGLPPSLLKKAEEVEAEGGVDRIRSLLNEVQRLNKSNAKILSDAMDILDQEATETENLLARQPHLAQSRPPSHVANQQLIHAAAQYENTIKQAAASDAIVRAKWDEWASRIQILADGQDALEDHIPSSTASSSGSGFSSLPAPVRPLRASLEELDDRIASRAALVHEAKHIAQSDDIRPEVLKEATRLAHGGSGDVKTEWFEDLFGKAMEKYDKLKDEMAGEDRTQEQLLERIRTQNEEFLAQRKDDPRIKARERSLQEMDQAYWKWREIVDNAEEGIKFYNSFAEMLGQFKAGCVQFLNSRRVDVGQITAQFQNVSVSNQSPSQSSAQPFSSPHSPPPQHQNHPHHSQHQASSSSYSDYQSHAVPSPPPPTHSPAPFLAHPSSSAWQAGSDFLPPPPPPPVMRSGGIPSHPHPQPEPQSHSQPHRAVSSLSNANGIDSPRRVTRSQTQTAQPPTPARTSSRGNIGDGERNPYKKGGTRREGGGVI